MHIILLKFLEKCWKKVSRWEIVKMMYNLISELNNGLSFTLSLDDKDSMYTGDDLRRLVSKNIKALNREDIAFISAACMKYGIKLMRWEFNIGVEAERSGFGASYLALAGKKINILTLYIRPMLKWEQE